MSWKGQQQWGGASAGGWGDAGGWGNTGGNAKGAGKQGKASQGKGSWGAEKAAPEVVKPNAWGKQPQQQSWGQQVAAAPKAAAVTKGAATPAATNISADKVKATLAKLTTDVTCQETMAKPSLEAATKALESEKPVAASFKSTIDSLEKHQTKLTELKATITKEVAEARKAGPAAATPAGEMQKLLIKCAKFCLEVTEKVNKMKPKHAKIQQEANFTRVETLTNAATEAATKALENEKATVPSIKAASESLEKQKAKLDEQKAALTKEIADARTAGPVSHSIAQELSKMLIKYNALNTQVLDKSNKLKFKLKKAENEAELKVKEAKDAAAFKPVLAKISGEVNTAVNTVNAVNKQVDPLVLKPPEAGAELDKKLEAIEKAAEEAVKKAAAARADLNEKFKVIQTYAPDTKKTATASLMELQKKLGDRINACQVYKDLRKHFPKLVANQKAVAEVTEKLAGHETPISKADKIAQGAKLTKAQVTTIDEILDPVSKAISEALIMATKMRGCDAATQEKLTKLKTRAEELKKKIEAVISKIKAQRDVIKSREAIELANEKLEKVEEGWNQCQDAELPFLTGFEVLPDDVNEVALKGCNDAIATASEAVNAARNWVSKHLLECKGYEKELGEKTSAELTPISKKILELEKKVIGFRQETKERAVTATVSNILGDFDKKVKSAENAGKTLASSSLDEETIESINAMIEVAKTALAAATKHAADAIKDLEAKKRESKVPHGSPAVAKITNSLSEGRNRLAPLRNSIAAGEKLVKTKIAVTSGEEAANAADANVQKAQKLVPKEGKKLSMEKITALDDAFATATKSATLLNSLVQPYVHSAPSKAKAALEKLLERKKEALEAISQIKKDTKEKREETLGAHYLEEAEAKTKAVEAADGKLSEAEGPFLTGATMNVTKTQEQLAKCAEVASEVQAAIAAGRGFSAQKTNDVKQFAEATSTTVKEGLSGMAERVNKIKTRLDAFNKDNKERTKESKMVDAQQKVDEIEANVKKVVAAAEPFEKEGADDLTEEAAAAPLKVFVDLDRDTKKQIEAARKHIADCEREQKGNAEHTETLKKLQGSVAKASQELVEKRKVIAPHEQKALGTKLVTETKEQIATLDVELKKATEACAALVEKGGEEFLVAASVKTLVAALKTHMQEKELTEDALIKEVSGGKKMKEDAFVKYLEKLAVAHDKLSTFSQERRVAIFKRLSAEGKYMTQEDFKAIFVQKYVCIKPVTVTNEFAMEGSETVCKVESGTTVDISGTPKEDESGLLRSECSVDGKKGWITLRQQKGPTFLTPLSSPFKQYCTDTEKVITEVTNAMQKASTDLSGRLGRGGQAKDGSRLKEARDEMTKLKEPILKAQKEMKDLVGKFQKAKGEYSNKERAEANLHIELKNKKEAAEFVEEPKAKLEAVEAAAKAAEEAAAPMVSLGGEELAAFATPATVLQKVEKSHAAVTEKAAEARESLKEQQKAVKEAKPQSGGTAEAQKQLASISQKLTEFVAKAAKAQSIVKGKCAALVKAKLDPAAEGIRKHAQAKKLSPEELFNSLKSGEKISEKAFSKLLGSLEGLSITAELAKLICQKLETDGISKDTFIKYVVIYYKVVKAIVFTDALDLTKCKTVRRGDVGEIIEVLEGPVNDEAHDMTRIRGRSTVGDKVTEGWVTVSGSKGTAFLEKTIVLSKQ